MAHKLVSGDSYFLEIHVWEDDDFSIPQDLSTIVDIEYSLMAANNIKAPIATFKWKESPYILTDLPNGKITVDLRGDENIMKEGQLYHKLHIVDDSGRKTTLLNEYISLSILPMHRG